MSKYQLNMKYTSILSFFIFGFLMNSCQNPEVEVPAYLAVHDISLETKASEGSASEKITDVWVSLGENFYGAYELPCTIPILEEGEFELKLRAGIKLNGINATRSAYSPYQICQATDTQGVELDVIRLTRDSITHVNAKTQYKETTNFKSIEGFESAGVQFESRKDVDTSNVQISASLLKTDEDAEVFEGNYSGYVHLTKEQDYVTILSSEWIDIPQLSSGKYNYFELDYKTEVMLNVGLWFNDISATQVNEIHLNPKEEWNKNYIYIKPERAYETTSPVFGSTQYKVFMVASLPEDMDEAWIYLDNLKLIHENE
ncbi:MAG: hypothetical protein ACPGEC_04710 [Flavobacteriales bacterium]